MDFDQFEQRSVMQILTLEKSAPKKIHECLVAVYGESVASYSTVKYSSSRFKRGLMEPRRRRMCMMYYFRGYPR